MPKKDPASGKENLYHWEVRLFNFDKKSSLHSDLEQLKKKCGRVSIAILNAVQVVVLNVKCWTLSGLC